MYYSSMKLIIRTLSTALALLIVAFVLPGIAIHGVYTALIVAFVLGILNAIVRPILIVLTLPITLLTLGLFILVINAGIFLFVASFVDGFEVLSFFDAVVGSVLVSLMSSIINKIV